MTKINVTVILILIIFICIIKSKHTPIIIKNNIKAFLIQTFISTLAIIFASSLSAEIYKCNSSIIIYNKPSDGFWKKFFTEAFFCESIIRIICMILFVPTLFMWIGIELKGVSIKKLLKEYANSIDYFNKKEDLCKKFFYH